MSSETATSASSSSPTKVTARCLHFGACGGCSRQDLAYEAQLAAKRGRVRALLAPLGLEPSAVHPSPDVWHYRNKMEFSFGDVYPPVPGGPTVLLGLKPKGRWWSVLDLAECHLPSPEVAGLLAAVRAWAERERLTPYNRRKHVGFLRNLLVREAKNGPDRLVLAVTSPGDFPRESFLAAVRAAYSATTILRGTHASVSDTAACDSTEVLQGPGWIEEALRFPGRELRFRVSPQSFFQTNTRGAEVLYGLLRGWVEEAGASRVLDLYCGGGGIALSLADRCASVVGVESNAAAVSDARDNAGLNGTANAQFYCGAAETLLPSLLDLRPDVAVADPPRAGLHAKAVATLVESGPSRLLYVSCNPEALARDLKLLEGGYAPKRCEIVDLFPHTEHVETVVRLDRR